VLVVLVRAHLAALDVLARLPPGDDARDRSGRVVLEDGRDRLGLVARHRQRALADRLDDLVHQGRVGVMLVLVGSDVRHRERCTKEVVDAHDHRPAQPELLLPAPVLARAALVLGAATVALRAVHARAGGLVARPVAMPAAEPDVLEGLVLLHGNTGPSGEFILVGLWALGLGLVMRLHLLIARALRSSTRLLKLATANWVGAVVNQARVRLPGGAVNVNHLPDPRLVLAGLADQQVGDGPEGRLLATLAALELEVLHLNEAQADRVVVRNEEEPSLGPEGRVVPSRPEGLHRRVARDDEGDVDERPRSRKAGSPSRQSPWSEELIGSRRRREHLLQWAE
jgi:hypothetical protein